MALRQRWRQPGELTNTFCAANGVFMCRRVLARPAVLHHLAWLRSAFSALPFSSTDGFAAGRATVNFLHTGADSAAGATAGIFLIHWLCGKIASIFQQPDHLQPPGRREA